jgi:hypothetical protein
MQRKMRHVLHAAVVVTIFCLSPIASTAAELVVSGTIQEAVWKLLRRQCFSDGIPG